MELKESDLGYNDDEREMNRAALERCRERLGKYQTNVEYIVKTFYRAKEQLAVYLNDSEILVELAWGTAQPKELQCVGVFPPGREGLEHLIQRLNERV